MYNGGNKHWMAGNILCVSCYCPEHYPEITESENSSNFLDNLADTWAKEHGAECICITVPIMHHPVDKLNSAMDVVKCG